MFVCKFLCVLYYFPPRHHFRETRAHVIAPLMSILFKHGDRYKIHTKKRRSTKEGGLEKIKNRKFPSVVYIYTTSSSTGAG